MKVSTSILSIKANLQENLKKLDNTNTDYIHLDIMDGMFVSNKTWGIEYISDLLKTINKPLDIHLMVSDLDSYIKDFLTLNPEYITFHLEASNEIKKYIKLIKSNGVKVGLSIKPDTKVETLLPYIDDIDLILIMSVEPGAGGQKFIESTCNRIEYFKIIKDMNNYNYIIEVDGGINADNIFLISHSGADMVVSGSYITNTDNYQEKIDLLKNLNVNNN